MQNAHEMLIGETPARLDENYEMAEGVCIPRNTLYLHYVDFCAKNSMQPVNAASFGKVGVRQLLVDEWMDGQMGDVDRSRRRSLGDRFDPTRLDSIRFADVVTFYFNR